jgi:hypothetical protein
MFGIGLPELIILYIITAVIIITGSIALVIVFLANVRKKKEFKNNAIEIRPPPLPKINEID